MDVSLPVTPRLDPENQSPAAGGNDAGDGGKGPGLLAQADDALARRVAERGDVAEDDWRIQRAPLCRGEPGRVQGRSGFCDGRPALQPAIDVQQVALGPGRSLRLAGAARDGAARTRAPDQSGRLRLSTGARARSLDASGRVSL